MASYLYPDNLGGLESTTDALVMSLPDATTEPL